MMFRQGDLLIVPVKEVKGKLQKDRILALGEATGHTHQMDGGEVYASNGEKYVKLAKTQKLLHEEHGEITLPKGNYKVTRQREYKPAKRRTTQVKD